MKRTFAGMVIVLAAVGLAAGESAAQGHEAIAPQPHHTHGHGASALQAVLAVPAAIRTEHEHLHQSLEEAINAGGKTGDAARRVAAVLSPHFEAEEAYAMPPLGLLERIAKGEPISDGEARAAIEMAGKLRAHYGRMIEEHREIQQALRQLADAAKGENKPGPAAFAETLMLHAANEEQVLYPTTLLIGEYLKLKRDSAHGQAPTTRPAGHSH